MKIYSLLASLGVCCGIVGVANADIVTGNATNYFSNMYATNVAGDMHTPQHDDACKSKYWFLLNTGFRADFRVNTSAGTNTAFMTYANEEIVLSGKYDGVKHRYMFNSNGVGEALQKLNAVSVTFSLDQEMYHSAGKIAFHSPDYTPGEETTTTRDDACDCTCDCCADHHCHPAKPEGFHCVISTY